MPTSGDLFRTIDSWLSYSLRHKSLDTVLAWVKREEQLRQR